MTNCFYLLVQLYCCHLGADVAALLMCHFPWYFVKFQKWALREGRSPRRVRATLNACKHGENRQTPHCWWNRTQDFLNSANHRATVKWSKGKKMHRFSYSNSKKLQKLKVLTKTRSYVLCHVQPMHTAHTLRVQQKTDTQKNKKNMLSDKQCCVFHCFWCSYVCSCKITVPPNSFTN